MILSLLFLCARAFALEPIVVQENRGSDFLSGRSWEAHSTEPEKALTTPGLSFAAYGGPGQTRSVFLRGARAEDTLVLLDGVPLNDPLSPSRAFDFSELPGQVEGIEILKGPQSVLYGGDALGGVVKLFSPQETLRPWLRTEAGAYDTYRLQGRYLGAYGGYEQSAGFSAADERDGNTEKDAYRAWNLGGKKDLSLDEQTNLRLVAFYRQSRTDTDKNGGPGGDSTGTFAESSRLVFRAETLHLFDSGIEWLSAASLSSGHRDDNTVAPSAYDADLWKLETQAQKTFGAHTPLVGVNYFEEAGESTEIGGRRKFRGGALFAHDRFHDGRWEAEAGSRFDFQNDHEKALTFGTGAAYWIAPGHWKAEAHLGSAFKAPTLYQTYSSYGNPGLAPSRSVGGDIGLLWQDGRSAVELSYYANRFYHLIDYDFARQRYFNVGRAHSQGLELSAWRSLSVFTVRDTLTTIQAKDDLTGLKLLRRPALANTVEISYKEGRAGANLLGRYVGRREDLHPSLFTRQEMPPFFTLGMDGFYRVGEWKVFARAENLLDRHYQETSGFGTAGRSFSMGAEGTL